MLYSQESLLRTVRSSRSTSGVKNVEPMDSRAYTNRARALEPIADPLRLPNKVKLPTSYMHDLSPSASFPAVELGVNQPTDQQRDQPFQSGANEKNSPKKYNDLAGLRQDDVATPIPIVQSLSRTATFGAKENNDFSRLSEDDVVAMSPAVRGPELTSVQGFKAPSNTRDNTPLTSGPVVSKSEADHPQKEHSNNLFRSDTSRRDSFERHERIVALIEHDLASNRADFREGDSADGVKAPTRPGIKVPAHPEAKAPTHTGVKAPTYTGARAPTHNGVKAPTHNGVKAPNPP